MNWKRWLLVGVLPMALLAGALVSVSAQDETLETLQIAFIGRQDGRGAALDRQLFQAAVTAANQINAGDDDDEAGVRANDGERYALEIVYYPADTADESVDALANAADDGVIGVLGPHEGDYVDAIQSAGTSNLAVLAGAVDAPGGSGVIHLSSEYDDWSQAAADYLVNERHMTRIAVISSNTDAALAGTDAFKTAAGTGVIVADIVREADETDFNEAVQTLRDADAEALFVWALDAQMIALLETLETTNWDGMIVYAGLDGEFIANVGSELIAGVFGPAGWSAAAYDARSQAFVNDYTAQWGVTPPDAAAAYYDGVYLIAESISDVGTDASAIRNDLSSSLDIVGVQGSYDNAMTDTVLLMQVQADGTMIEAARYADGDCLSCPDTWWADSSDDIVTSSETIRIGLIAALDGVNEPMGAQIEQAAQVAVRDINDAGGVVGPNSVRYTLNLVTYSATSAEAVAAVYDQATQDGVDILIGPDFNAQVVPNAFRAESAGVVQLVSATLDKLTGSSDGYLFQMRATDTVLAQTTARYLLDTRELTRFASVAVRTDYGLDGTEAFNVVIRDSDDGEVLLELEHDLDATDFAILADQLVAADVEGISLWTTQPAAAALMRELNARGWDGVVVYGYLTPDFASSIGQMTFELVAPVNWWQDTSDWVGSDFAARYNDRYGETPLPQAAAYYDAVHLIARGLDEAGASGLQPWITGLDNFNGVQGSYNPSVYENGEMSRNVTILSHHNGVTQVAARYDDGVCLIGCDS
ncbi:MAG: ABC transporter substrate-binding protein [Chloroflexota bacterium]|nr:ABC transporter substrate-binding protein [Chloroflexota bacterium]